jgi:hypothetical protein
MTWRYLIEERERERERKVRVVCMQERREKAEEKRREEKRHKEVLGKRDCRRCLEWGPRGKKSK